jgi:molybdenum cofactor cytidylyltransferase
MDEDDLPLDSLVGVVLAGGTAARMGSNKLLMDVGAGRPMIRHVVETVRGIVSRVIVVVGYQEERVREAVARLAVDFVRSDAEADQNAAIAAGLAASAASDPGLATVVCVGDQPRLTGREIVGLIEAYRQGDGTRVLVPMRQGVRGYPMIVPPGFDATGLDLTAPDLAVAHPDRAEVFETRNPVYESSIDTPEDYRTLFAI